MDSDIKDTATINREWTEVVNASPTLVELDVDYKLRQYAIILKKEALIITPKDKNNFIKYLNTDTIVGFDYAGTERPNRVLLHTCINTSGDITKEIRKRKDYTFDFGTLDLAKQFTDAIQTHVLDAMPGGPPHKRRVRVILNPKSGKRMAEEIYKKVELLFKNDAKMSVKKTVTKGPEHAKQIGYKFKHEKYDTIAFISGDGLFHEFINGLLARDDWMEVRNIRLCLIPGGTGNGIACSLGLADSMSSALACVRGHSRPLDVSIVEQGEQKWCSILSLTWGLVSDVDIESERFRSLGPIRLQLGAAIRILNLRVYKGKISYLPAVDQPKSELNKIPRCGPNCEICTSVDSVQHINNILSNSSDGVAPPPNVSSLSSSPLNSSGSFFLNNSGSISRTSNGTSLLNGSNDNISPLNGSSPPTSSLNSSINSSYQNTTNSTSSPQSTTPLNTSGTIPTRDIVVPLPKIPTGGLSQSIGINNEWKTIEGEFIGFIASTVTHLSADFIASPSAHYSDGFIEMIVIKYNPKISKAALVSILTDAETGKHIHSPYIDLYKVRAIVLEPGHQKNKEGILAVDGERISYGKTSMECIRGCINLVSKDR